MDNASIHKCYGFARRVNELGGMVLFTLAYCFDCTPLDNGAFGLVKRYLKKHSDIFSRVSMEEALDAAFESVGARHARYCFKLCKFM